MVAEACGRQRLARRPDRAADDAAEAVDAAATDDSPRTPGLERLDEVGHLAHFEGTFGETGR
jgi:hypothetical protein